jgi:hypothetical protein
MKSAADQLLEHQKTPRRYWTSPAYIDVYNEERNQLRNQFPGCELPTLKTDPSKCRIGPTQYRWRGAPAHWVEVKHLIVEGKADWNRLETAFQIELPQCLKDFYSKIQAATLVLDGFIVIHSPDGILELETMYRQIERETNSGRPCKECSLLRFVSFPGIPAQLALRRWRSDGIWRVVLTYDDADTFEMQENDQIFEESQLMETLDEWMERILATNGSPVVAGRERLVYNGWVESVQDDLKSSVDQSKLSLVSAADQLLEHQKMPRRYWTTSEYVDLYDRQRQRFHEQYPGSTLPELKNEPQKHSIGPIPQHRWPDSTVQGIEARHLIVEGKADWTRLENTFQMELPGCLKDFYSKIQTAALALDGLIIIESPDRIVDIESEHRRIERETKWGRPCKEYSLLRFVSFPKTPRQLALRRWKSDGVWRVVVTYSHLDTHEMQKNDRIFEEEQPMETLDEWMARILATNGSPVAIGFEGLFRNGWVERVPAEQWG